MVWFRIVRKGIMVMTSQQVLDGPPFPVGQFKRMFMQHALPRNGPGEYRRVQREDLRAEYGIVYMPDYDHEKSKHGFVRMSCFGSWNELAGKK